MQSPIFDRLSPIFDRRQSIVDCLSPIAADRSAVPAFADSRKGK